MAMDNLSLHITLTVLLPHISLLDINEKAKLSDNQFSMNPTTTSPPAIQKCFFNAMIIAAKKHTVINQG